MYQFIYDIPVSMRSSLQYSELLCRAPEVLVIGPVTLQIAALSPSCDLGYTFAAVITTVKITRNRSPWGMPHHDPVSPVFSYFLPPLWWYSEGCF